MLSGPLLLLVLLIAVLFIIYMTAKIRLHAFLVLLLAALGTGLLAGMPLSEIIDTVSSGFGDMLGYIGIVIAAGTIIGTILEKSGGTRVMAGTVLRFIGQDRTALAVSLTGAVVSIPVFCDSGFVILSPVNKALARRSSLSLTTLSVALAGGLYATHTLVPPTPGPIAAAAQVEADLGYVIILGLIVAVPVIITSYLWSVKFVAHYQIEPDILEEKEVRVFEDSQLPGSISTFAPVVVPIFLISLSSLANYPGLFSGGRIKEIILFLGDPVTALIIGVFLAFNLLPSLDKEYINNWVSTGLKNAASIIMITGAGGAFGSILKSSGIGDYLGGTLANYHLGILLPFVIAAALKTAQGSSTVALITTSSLVAPLLPKLGLDSEIARALVVMATGAGAMTFSHANDSFFWVVSQFSGMKTDVAYKTFSTATLLQGLTAIAIIGLMSLFLL